MNEPNSTNNPLSERAAREMFKTIYMNELVEDVDIPSVVDQLQGTFTQLIEEGKYTQEQMSFLVGVLNTLQEYPIKTIPEWFGITQVYGSAPRSAQVETIEYDEEKKIDKASGVLINITAPQPFIDIDPNTHLPIINMFGQQFPRLGYSDFGARIAVFFEKNTDIAEAVKLIYTDTPYREHFSHIQVSDHPNDPARCLATYVYTPETVLYADLYDDEDDLIDEDTIKMFDDLEKKLREQSLPPDDMAEFSSADQSDIPDAASREEEVWLTVPTEDRLILVSVPIPRQNANIEIFNKFFGL